jgi:hypothetical protein
VDGISLAPLSQAASKDPNYHAAVAVGDTFLFSFGNAKSGRRRDALFKLADSASAQQQGEGRIAYLQPLMSDCYCLTHAVPYYRVLLGVGQEEKSAQRLLACLRSPHMYVNIVLTVLSMNMCSVIDPPCDNISFS